MKKNIFLICIFFSQICVAQESVVNFSLRQTDSLKKELVKNIKEDSVRVDNLEALASAYISSDPVKSQSYAQQALELSKKLKSNLGIITAYQQLGSIAVNNSEYLTALDYFQKAISTSEIINKRIITAQIRSNIAMIYLNTGEYDKALSMYRYVIDIMQKEKETYLESVAILNEGLAYFRKNDFLKSIVSFDKSLKIARDSGYIDVIAYSLSNKAAAYNQTGKYDSALIAFKSSIKYCDLGNIESLKSESLNGMAESNIYLKRYEDAIAFIKQSLAISKPLSSLQYQKESYQMLSDIYNKQKNYEESLKAYKQFVVLRDSIMNDDKKSEITRKQMQYEFDKKEVGAKSENNKKQALATAAIKQEKTVKDFVLSGALVLLVASILIFIFYKRRRDAEEQRHEAEFKVLTLDTELKALRAQMNPHFIYNSLNSINDYIDKHDTKNATLYTTKFAKLMRMILENSEQKEVPISADLKALELYMQLEALRMNNKFTYEIKVDDNIDQENTLIPPLILQPFVENSIWHGLGKKQGEGKILIHIKKEGNMINCILQDNGIGIHENNKQSEENFNRKTFGMKITRARIDIINRIKNAEGAVTMTNLEEGIKIEVRLPEALAF